MAIKFGNSITLNGFQIMNFVVHSSAVAPSAPKGGMMWWDSTNKSLNYYNDTLSAWISSVGSPGAVSEQVGVFSGTSTISGYSGLTYRNASGELDVATIKRADGHLQHIILSAGNGSGVAGNDGGHVYIKAGNAINGDSGSTPGNVYLVPGNNQSGTSCGDINLGSDTTTGGSRTIRPIGSASQIGINIVPKGNAYTWIGAYNTGSVSVHGVTFYHSSGIVSIFRNNTNITAIQLEGGGAGPTYNAGNIRIVGGNGSWDVGRENGGHVYIRGGTPVTGGVKGNIYFGTGTEGYLPVKSTEGNVVYYDETTGKLSYGIPPVGGGGMVYPSAGIALSNGVAWSSSITNNSTNWNTAYGWGDHSTIGYMLTTDFNTLFELVGTAPNQYIRCKYPFAGDYEIQAWSDTGWLPPTIWESMPLATTTSVGGIIYVTGGTRFLREDGTWQTVTSGSPMVYPGAGIPVSTGAAWATSITDNSINWNTAYSWGNHAGLYSLTGHNHTGVYQPIHANLTSLAGLTYTSAAFVKMTGANTFTLDTNTYATASGTMSFSNKTINASSNTITDTSIAAGDLLKSNGTKFVRFARGSALQVLRVNSSGTDLEYATINSLVTTNFTIVQESGKLVIKYGSTIIASISSLGLITAADEVVAFGTP